MGSVVNLIPKFNRVRESAIQAGKARCDNKRPECSRCKSKGVECHYPTKTSNASKSTTQQHANDAETERLNTIAQSVADIPGLDTFLDATNDGDIPLDRALVIADSEITAVGERYSDDIMPDVDFADLLNVHMDGENILYTPSGSSSSVYQSISSADEVVQVQHPRPSPKLSIPPVPTQAIRSLVQRPMVNMLVYFEPAAMCGLRTDLVIAPLPARKQLWEAGDELLWKAESQRESGFQTVYGLAASGDLVQLGKDQLHSTNEVLLHKTVTARGSANWEEWCSGMDGLGGLVMLAASLAGTGQDILNTWANNKHRLDHTKDAEAQLPLPIKYPGVQGPMIERLETPRTEDVTCVAHAIVMVFDSYMT
ncbi:unnamed protein product [Aspergillus oryzae]|uniref:Unnamed protein product n=1 Tax=Aspergillus oryzae TaxID=5062 RepID=A0AAN5BYQ2_ASPOZ|nr:unnamed protein product [Aspergillus oryzae]